jgi:hypothetical protein
LIFFIGIVQQRFTNANDAHEHELEHEEVGACARTANHGNSVLKEERDRDGSRDQGGESYDSPPLHFKF